MLSQDRRHVSQQAHRVRGSADSDADISALEGGCIIDAVAGHAHTVAQLPQRLHDQVLMLRVHLRSVCNFSASSLLRSWAGV
jgi:hypothetical protein